MGIMWSIAPGSRHHDFPIMMDSMLSNCESKWILLSSCWFPHVCVCACMSIHLFMCIWRPEVATGCPPLLFSALPSEAGSLLSSGIHHGTRLPGQQAISFHPALHPLPPALLAFSMGAGDELGPSCLHRKPFPHQTTFLALLSCVCQVYFVTMRKVTSTEHYLEFVKETNKKPLCCLHHADSRAIQWHFLTRGFLHCSFRVSIHSLLITNMNHMEHFLFRLCQ